MGATQDWNGLFQLGLEWTISIQIGMDHSNLDLNAPLQLGLEWMTTNQDLNGSFQFGWTVPVTLSATVFI